MIHAITTRYLWIRDKRGENYFKKLKSGDILLFHDKCSYAGAANDTKRISISIYVPIGFRHFNTFNSAIHEANV